MPIFIRKKRPLPVRHTHDRPQWPGAWLFAVRTAPRHYYVLHDVIESTGDARVWFGEPLAYIRGKGIALFRIEATGFDWIEPLFAAWRKLQHDEAAVFDIEIYVNNTEWVATFRGRTPDEIEQAIRETAPKHEAVAAS